MRIFHADCREVLSRISLVDAVVTDPPYGLSFMGKGWDHGVPGVEFWRVIGAAMKPGAHLLAFGGTRTFHRLTCAIEDAGFEIRDCVMWVYGTGFPKSLDVSKAIDKAAGADREVVGSYVSPEGTSGASDGSGVKCMAGKGIGGLNPITASATDAAKQWDGWGTALKPAWEPIILARKPLEGTVAANVLEHGTGALNVDACRIEHQTVAGGNLAQNPHLREKGIKQGTKDREASSFDMNKGDLVKTNPGGRWPANLIHDGSEEVVELFPSPHGAGKACETTPGVDPGNWKGVVFQHGGRGKRHGDLGSAARFFYCAKASKKDRGEDNDHPTVKPTDLMRYLCRLVTPPGGMVLDPFMGSGSTGKAALLEGFGFVGIDEDEKYCEIARRRLTLVEEEVLRDLLR